MSKTAPGDKELQIKKLRESAPRRPSTVSKLRMLMAAAAIAATPPPKPQGAPDGAEATKAPRKAKKRSAGLKKQRRSK